MSPQGPGRICVGVVSSCLVQCATVAVMKWGRARRGALQPWLWPRPPRKVCQRALAPPVEVFAVPQFPSSTSNRAPLLEKGTAPASPRTVLYCRFSHQLNSHTGEQGPCSCHRVHRRCGTWRPSTPDLVSGGKPPSTRQSQGGQISFVTRLGFAPQCSPRGGQAARKRSQTRHWL